MYMILQWDELKVLTGSIRKPKEKIMKEIQKTQTAKTKNATKKLFEHSSDSDV